MFSAHERSHRIVIYLRIRHRIDFFPHRKISVWLHLNERDHTNFPSWMLPRHCFSLRKSPPYWFPCLNTAPYWFIIRLTAITFFSSWMGPTYWFRFMKCGPILISFHQCGHCIVSVFEWGHCIDLYSERDQRIYSSLLIFPHWFIINKAVVFISIHKCDHRPIYIHEWCHATFFSSE
jgi:hypothetical protein